MFNATSSIHSPFLCVLYAWLVFFHFLFLINFCFLFSLLSSSFFVRSRSTANRNDDDLGISKRNVFLSFSLFHLFPPSFSFLPSISFSFREIERGALLPTLPFIPPFVITFPHYPTAPPHIHERTAFETNSPYTKRFFLFAGEPRRERDPQAAPTLARRREEEGDLDGINCRLTRLKKGITHWHDRYAKSDHHFVQREKKSLPHADENRSPKKR